MSRIEKQKFTLAKAPNIDPLGGNGYFVARFPVIDRTLPSGSPEFIHCDMRLLDKISAKCDVLGLRAGSVVVLSGTMTEKDGVQVLEVTDITMPTKVREADLDSPSL